MNKWNCLICGKTGNNGNFCGGCGSPKPESEKISALNHIEYDEESYNTIMRTFNSISDSYKGTISSACSNINRAVSSFPDKYSVSGLDGVEENIESKISLIKSLSEIINYSILAYQACDETLRDGLYSLVDSLFGDTESDLSDYFKNITDSIVEEKDGILKYKDFVSDDFKYYNFLSTFYEKRNSDDSFLSTLGGNYGIDQGIFTNLRKKDPKLYQKTKEMLMKEYGFTNNSVEQFFGIVDAVGCCNMAAGANTIALAFKDNPDEFEKIFGFSYYRETSNGEKTLNDVRLLADYYIWANTVGNNDAVILTRDENGSLVINENSYILDSNGKYDNVHQTNGRIKDAINEYLQYKSNGTYQAQVSEIINQQENYTPDEIKEKVIESLNSGNQVAMGMLGSENDSINYVASFENYELKGPHWVAVTGANDDGILVSSWGIKYFIPYSDLSCVSLFTVDINNN